MISLNILISPFKFFAGLPTAYKPMFGIKTKLAIALYNKYKPIFQFQGIIEDINQ